MVVIVVINGENGRLAEHTISNQSVGWSTDEAVAWVERVEIVPWEYHSHLYIHPEEVV